MQLLIYLFKLFSLTSIFLLELKIFCVDFLHVKYKNDMKGNFALSIRTRIVQILASRQLKNFMWTLKWFHPGKKLIRIADVMDDSEHNHRITDIMNSVQLHGSK